ncbi:hypothetical protein EJ02DRAFT_456905 [Clathrospora elynae]|uniref:Uncharacterized protein n=1 Tax=Clathrospora elynae TaxID=706981 RepID=A0A6A5SII6_9PLEO|nr:hypothetical protein EJ02DRAFT_456905 [Clathrospora elynae]
MIYTCLTDDIRRPLAEKEPRRTTYLRLLWQDPLQYSIDDDQCHSYQRVDAGLLYSSRLTRFEYLPLYLQHTNVYLSVHHLAIYAASLLPQEPFVLPLGNVIVGFNGWLMTPEKWRQSAVNIAPFLHLYKRHAQINITLDPIAGYEFSKIFDIQEYEKWWNCFEQQVDSLWVWPNTYALTQRAKAHFYIKKDYCETWMRRNCKDRKPKMTSNWIESVGLRHLRKWRDMRGVSGRPRSWML